MNNSRKEEVQQNCLDESKHQCKPKRQYANEVKYKGSSLVSDERNGKSGQEDSWVLLVSKSMSGLYCLLMVAVYVTITANRLTNSPMHHPEVEVTAMLLYMYFISCAFLLYLLCHLATPRLASLDSRSHASAFLRQGAVVFGLGALVYCTLEFLTFFLMDLHPDCTDWLVTANSLLAMLLVLLQMTVVVMHPRLKLAPLHGLTHLGLMHLIATNLILWMRTVIRESIHEFHLRLLPVFHLPPSEPSHHGEGDHSQIGFGHGDPGEGDHSLKMEVYSERIEHCMKTYHEDDFVSSTLKSSSPTLYAFIIEFSLVAVTFFYSTWSTVGPHNRKETETTEKQPDLIGALKKVDWSHSAYGAVAGLFTVVLTLSDLVFFFSDQSTVPTNVEYLGKVHNCVLNYLGLIISAVAIYKVQGLQSKTTKMEQGLNIFLLMLGVFFVYIYSCLTITVGVFTTDHHIPGGVHVANGVFELMAVSLQIILTCILMTKSGTHGLEGRPGRQAITYLCFLNFSIWLLDSFEIQKSKASLVESDFYGVLVWIWMQRITLPFCIFYRFHSTVVFVECWKISYRSEAPEEKAEKQELVGCERCMHRSPCLPCDISPHYI